MEQIETKSAAFKEDEEVYSSEEEQERAEEEKEKFTATVTVNALSGPVRNVLVCAPGNA